MIVDTSALMAVLLREDGWTRYARALGEADVVLLSAATFVEAGIVAEGRGGPDLATALDELLTEVGAQVWPVSVRHAQEARDAWRRFGKGNHPARLNFGDCFAYALAKRTGDDLLFKGDDFAQTDVKSAL